MDKQEKEKLISFIEKEKENITLKHGKYSQTHFGFIWGTKLIEFIEQLDEPQKVKVPAYVAEYIEAHRKWGPEIFIGDWLADNDAVYKWLYNNSEKENNRRFLIAVKAFVEGYEVEEEPLYTVTINLDLKYHLAVDEGDDDEISTTLTTSHDVLGYRYFLTEKEIKAIDERYWPFAVPVEEVVEG